MTFPRKIQGNERFNALATKVLNHLMLKFTYFNIVKQEERKLDLFSKRIDTAKMIYHLDSKDFWHRASGEALIS